MLQTVRPLELGCFGFDFDFERIAVGEVVENDEKGGWIEEEWIWVESGGLIELVREIGIYWRG